MSIKPTKKSRVFFPEVVGGGGPEAEHPGDSLLAANQHPLNVVLPGPLRGLVLDQEPGDRYIYI